MHAIDAKTAGRAFAGTALRVSPHRHQRRALDAFEQDRARGDRSTYLVLPPGAGKTLVGLEIVRRLGRRTLVLGPNTAIQAQWISQWSEFFAPAVVTPGNRRTLGSPLTVLTYQALCTIDPESTESEPEARSHSRRAARDGDPEALLSLLHRNGRKLIERMHDSGPWTLVLDECHHLLELWGHLLRSVVDQLDDPFVIGLTATPPRAMTAEQADVHRTLFGRVDLEVSAPAVVRDGRLAPYQELVYLTRPTPAEADYIHGETERFAELRTDLLDPAFAATPFLAWVRSRAVERRTADGPQLSWGRFERDDPDLADAAVRLHVAGLLPLPDGARVREQHRHAPTAEDWVTLIDDYCRRCLRRSDDPRDRAAMESIRRALPAVGYRLTRGGVRAAASPVDRVLARSASKARAATEILGQEAAELGDRLRGLVLCDHERATAKLPARLADVLHPQAGGARLLLETLLADPDTAALDPVLLTGRTVACGRATARRLVSWLRTAEPELGPTEVPPGDDSDVVEVAAASRWTPRRYVPLVTRFYDEGGTRCLVGTRGLLGEGWDARGVNALIDLTAATTPTSVVQARGRALRINPDWPAKVADNWSVACVADDHPKGAADYERFVRKHDGYFALTRSGEIESDVSHVDPELSPYAPPPTAAFDAINARMLARVAERAKTRELWAIGTPYEDEPVRTVTVASRRPLGLPGRTVMPLTERRSATVPVLAVGIAAAAGLALAAVRPALAVIPLAALLAAGVLPLTRRAARLTRVPAAATLEGLAHAVADGLHAAGVTGRGAGAVTVEVTPGGAYRALLRDVPVAESATFADALDEVVAPLAAPRYVVPRLVVPQPASRRAAVRLGLRRLLRRPVAAAVVYHAVPSSLGANRRLADAFGRAWNTYVSPGEPLYTGSPEGAGVLAAQRGDDPFAVTTQLRTLWR